MEDKKQQTEEALKDLFSDSMLSFIPETNNRADMIQPNTNQSTESSDVANPESSNNLNVNVNITQNVIQREVERAVEGILNTTSNPTEVKKNYIGNYQEGNISSNFVSAPSPSVYDTRTTISSPTTSPQSPVQAEGQSTTVAISPPAEGQFFITNAPGNLSNDEARSRLTDDSNPNYLKFDDQNQVDEAVRVESANRLMEQTKHLNLSEKQREIMQRRPELFDRYMHYADPGPEVWKDHGNGFKSVISPNDDSPSLPSPEEIQKTIASGNQQEIQQMMYSHFREYGRSDNNPIWRQYGNFNGSDVVAAGSKLTESGDNTENYSKFSVGSESQSPYVLETDAARDLEEFYGMPNTFVGETTSPYLLATQSHGLQQSTTTTETVGSPVKTSVDDNFTMLPAANITTLNELPTILSANIPEKTSKSPQLDSYDSIEDIRSGRNYGANNKNRDVTSYEISQNDVVGDANTNVTFSPVYVKRPDGSTIHLEREYDPDRGRNPNLKQKPSQPLNNELSTPIQESSEISTPQPPISLQGVESNYNINQLNQNNQTTTDTSTTMVSPPAMPSPEPPATVNNIDNSVVNNTAVSTTNITSNILPNSLQPQERIGLYSYTPPSQKQTSTINPNDEDAMYNEYLQQQAKEDAVVEALAVEQTIMNSTGDVVASRRAALDALMFSKTNNSTNTSTARGDTVYQTVSTPLQYTNLTPSREWTNDDLNNPFYAANPSVAMDKIYPDQTGSDYIRQQLGMNTPNQVSFDRGSGAEIITRFPPTDTQKMAEEIYRDNNNLYSRQNGGGVAFHSMDAYISNNNPVYGKPSDDSLYGMRYIGGDDPRIEKIKIQSFGSGYGTNEHGIDTYVENRHMSQQEFFVNQEPTELVRTPRQPEITVLETFRPLRPDQKQENDFDIRTPGTPTYNDYKFHEYYNNFILQDANDELERKREEIKRSVEVRRQEIQIEKAREKQTAPVPVGLSPESPQPSPPQAPIDLQAVPANYNVDQLNTDTTNQTNVDSISYLNETEYANDPKTKPPVVNTTELYSSTQQVTNSPPVTNVVDNSVQNTSNIINNLYSSNSSSTSSILNSANNLRADMQTTSQNAQRWAEDNLGKTPEQRKFDSLPPELQAAEKEKRFITVTQDNGEKKLQDLQSEVPKLMTTQDVVSASESIGKQTQRNIAAGRSLQQRWAEEDKQRFIERYGQEAWDKASQQGSQYAENTFNEYKTNQLNSTHNNQNLSVEAQEFERQQQRDFERWDKGEIGDVKREGEYGAVESTTQVTSRTDSVLRQSERAGTAIQNSLDQINELQISSDFISSNETQSNQNISVEPVQNQFNTNVTNSTNTPESIVNTEVTEQPNSSVTTTSTSNTSNNPVNVQNNTTTNISNGVNVVTNNISSDTSYDTIEEIRAGKGFGGNNPTGNTTNITNNIDELADTYTPSKIEFLSPDQMFEQFLNMNTSNISGDSVSFAEDNGQTNIKYETAPTSNVVNNFNTTNYTSSQQVTSNNTYSPIRSGADVNTSYTNVTNNQTQQMYVNNDDMSKNITNSLESYFDATYSTRISTISKSSTTNMFTENVKNTIQDMLIEKGLDKDPFIKTDIQRNQRNMEISMEDPLDFKIVQPGDTKNIYENMMVFDPDITMMINKINSPPIWRTAIG